MGKGYVDSVPRGREDDVIDILGMELEQKLPHWLDPSQLYFDAHDVDRRRRHAEHIAQIKATSRGKSKPAKGALPAEQLQRVRKWLDRRGIKFDPDQPRDEDGRWTDSGGGDGGGGSEKPSAAKPAVDPSSASALREPEHVSTDELLDSVPGARAKVAAAREKLTGAIPTDAPVSKGGFKQPDGKWTPERTAAHKKILDAVFTPEAVAAATPKQGEQPVLHLLGGRGGSGKSWFTGPKGTIDKSKALYLNSDDFKGALPGYQGWNAALLHEESSEIGKAAEAFARDRKLNVIIDGTMKSGKQLADRVAAYRAAGYRIEGHYMYTSPATAAKRALERFVRGGETGRFVAPEYSLGSTSNEASFDGVRDQMDAWEIYDNNGSAPKFHARGTNIKLW